MLTLMTFAFALSNAKAMDGIYEYKNGNKLVRTKKDITFYMPAENASKTFKVSLPNEWRGKLIPIIIGEEEVRAPEYNCHLSTKMNKAQFDGEARKLGEYTFKPFVGPTPVIKNQQNQVDKFVNKLFNPHQKKRNARTKAMMERKVQEFNAKKQPTPVVQKQPTPVTKRPVRVVRQRQAPVTRKPAPVVQKQPAPARKRPVRVVRQRQAPVTKQPAPVVNKQPTPVTKRPGRVVRQRQAPVTKSPAPVVNKQPTPVTKRPVRVVRQRNRR